MIEPTNQELQFSIAAAQEGLRELRAEVVALRAWIGRATPHPTVTAPEAPTYATALGMVEADDESGQRDVPLAKTLRLLAAVTLEETMVAAQVWATVAAIAQHESGQPIEPGYIDFGHRLTVWQVLASFTEHAIGDQPTNDDWHSLAHDAFAALVQIVGNK